MLFMLTVLSAMYILAVLLTPVAFVMLLLLLLQAVQPRVPTIIVLHVHCTCAAASPDNREPNDEQENEDYWYTPVQETQHP